MSVSGLEVN